MKYKILFLLSIVFIISMSAVSAENVDNQTIGEIDNSIDMDNSILSDDVSGADENGTFNELEKILWRASDGDTITLDKDYFYDGADRKVIGVYRQITIDGAGHTLDGKKGARIFYVSSDAKSLTLKNINFVNAKIDGAGGAILNDGAELTITNCTFTNNRITGTTGGAIASNNANNVTITDCEFTNNYATGVGGAVSITGNNAKITNCVFTNNEARDHLGGAVLIYGNYATITNNTFKNNKAGRDGGAIDVEGKTESVKCTGAVITDNEFIGNTAAFGGAVGLNGNDATIQNNLFKSNQATYSKAVSFPGIGGAMRVIGAKNIMVISNTFTDNTAYNQGGAFYLEGADSMIFKNTFTNNHATNDAGGTMNLKGDGISISKNVIKGSSSKNAGGAIFINGNNVKITKNDISWAKTTSSYGGAIQIRGDAAAITKNTFTKNSAKSNGGALYIMSDKAVVTYNTFHKNTASKGLALYAKGDSPKTTGNTFVNRKTSNTFVWDKITPKLAAYAQTFKKSVKIKQYTITLKNDWKQPIKSKKVTLIVNGKIFKAITNTKGQATFKITNLNQKGKYTAKVKFIGNSYYYTIIKKPKITVK